MLRKKVDVELDKVEDVIKELKESTRMVRNKRCDLKINLKLFNKMLNHRFIDIVITDNYKEYIREIKDSKVSM